MLFSYNLLSCVCYDLETGGEIISFNPTKYMVKKQHGGGGGGHKHIFLNIFFGCKTKLKTSQLLNNKNAVN